MALQMPNETEFGLAIQQSGAGTEHEKMVAGFEVPETADANFYYYPFTDVAMGPTKNQDVLPPEIGGRALPGGAYATGVWAEGTVSLIPRLDNRFGWLLLASLGEVSTVSDTTIAHYVAGSSGADSGIYTHIFRFYETDQYFAPYCSFRRLLPHATAANVLGEFFQDGRMRSLTLTAAGASPVTCDLDMVARLYQSDYQFEFAPVWATPSYDDLDDFAVTNCSGHFKVEGTEFDVTTVSVTLTNNPLPPAQAMKIGDINPIDFPVLGRACTVTATILVSDYNLYVSTFTGAANAGVDANATCTVYKADLDAEFTTQTYISGSEPFRIRIRSSTTEDNVAWQVRPIRIVPNRPVVLQVTANLLATGSGDPLQVLLQNAKVNYLLP